MFWLGGEHRIWQNTMLPFPCPSWAPPTHPQSLLPPLISSPNPTSHPTQIGSLPAGGEIPLSLWHWGPALIGTGLSTSPALLLSVLECLFITPGHQQGNNAGSEPIGSGLFYQIRSRFLKKVQKSVFLPSCAGPNCTIYQPVVLFLALPGRVEVPFSSQVLPKMHLIIKITQIKQLRSCYYCYRELFHHHVECDVLQLLQADGIRSKDAFPYAEGIFCSLEKLYLLY